jgi:hypothetical protein
MNDKAKHIDTTEEQKQRIEQLRITFSDVYGLLELWCKPSRETSLAITKLEEAQFWAIKGISREKMED